MSPPHQALGRGLGALIPNTAAPTADAGTPQDATPEAATRRVPITAIRPSPDQPRSFIDPAALQELAASIREHGVLQPILVTGDDGGDYVIIAGERRWRAAQLAGLDDIPVVITDLANADAFTVALVENLQREDLNALEEAHAYQRLIERFSLTQQEVAQRVGKSRSAVTNALRLIELPIPIRLSLSAAEISEGHARAVLSAPGEAQRIRLWKRILQRQLSVRQTEAAARNLRNAEVDPAAAPHPDRSPPGDRLAEERVQAALATKVHVQRGRKGGRIVVHWYDDEQLESLVARLVRAGREPEAAPPDTLTI